MLLEVTPRVIFFSLILKEISNLNRFFLLIYY